MIIQIRFKIRFDLIQQFKFWWTDHYKFFADGRIEMLSGFEGPKGLKALE